MAVTTVYASTNGAILNSQGAGTWAQIRQGTFTTPVVDSTAATNLVSRFYAASKFEHGVNFSYEEFNTASVPGDISGATVTVDLNVYSDPLAQDGTWYLECSAGVLWTGGTVVSADWDYTARTVLGSLACAVGLGSGYKTISIPPSAVNQAGITPLMFRNDGFVADHEFTANLYEELYYYSADQTGTTQDPKIVVTSAPAPGEWTFLGVGNAVTVTSGALALVETGITGLQANDLLVACIAARGTPAFTIPSGWSTAVTPQTSGNTTVNTTASAASGRMDYIVRGASAPALSWARTAGDLGFGRIAAYRNVGNGVPTRDSGAQLTMGAQSTACTLTSGLTTTHADCLIVHALAMARNNTASAFDAVTDLTTASGATDATSGIVPASWTERADSGTTSGADGALAIADAYKATAGSTGNLTVTQSAGCISVLMAAAFYPVSTAIAGNLTKTEGADTLASAAGDRIATLARTEGADTLDSAGALAIAATLARAEGADTLAATAGDREADLSATEGADTVSSAAKLSIAGTLAATEGADTLASAAGDRTATLARTEGADTVASIAVLPIVGTLSAAEGADQLASSAGVAIQATLARTEGVDTLASSAGLAIAATLARTEGADTLASAAGDRTANLSATEGADTVAASSSASVQGNLARTEGADTVASAAVLSIAGSLAAAEGADTVAATASIETRATLARTEGADQLAAAGVLPIIATLARTEGADTVAANAISTITANVAAIEGADTLASAAGDRTANLSATEGADTATAAAQLLLQATFAGIEGADTLAASGFGTAAPILGTFARTEGADTLASAAVLALAATFARTEGADTLSALASFPATAGSLARTEGADTLTASAVAIDVRKVITLFL